RFEVHEFSTGYGKQALLLYLPEEKVIFIRDHGNSALKTGLPEYDEYLKDLLSEIARLNLDVERVARVHGARLFTLTEMREADALPEPNACYNQRPICAGIDLEGYAPKYPVPKE
ncbi:MAG TPA: hypothetical protein VD713_07890, partial [Sphingomonadales bacterium]|nr:hypothetical protein [Sphingomonadales bacterium]